MSEAVRQGWDIGTTDISKAFLQGVTYEELAQLTGEKPREVNFYLPASSVAILRKVPGFESFDPQREVLHCDKPGTGLVDAPRAFSIKLKLVIKRCRLFASQVDPELCFRHEDSQLVCLMTIHVDDLKLAGRPEIVKMVLKELEATFGQLKIVWNDFVNCGIRHYQDVRTKEIWLDQIDYAKNLRTIEHVQMKNANPETFCDDSLHKLYMSLLGAVAYLSHTRPDVVVFVSALQRHNAKPQVQHVRKLNKVLRWLQQHPKRLAYRRKLAVSQAGGGSGAAEASRSGTTHLRIVSDAAFKKETDSGHSSEEPSFYEQKATSLRT